MILHFGLDFDGIVHTPQRTALADELFAGPQKLLSWLEYQLGLHGYPENTDYLRIELYRQALQQYLAETKLPEACFCHASFQSDRFAAAAALLAWRDELLLAGWDFLPSTSLPPRLAVFAAVETLFKKKISDPEAGPEAFGWADRFVQVLAALQQRPLSLKKIWLYEPGALQPPLIQRFIQIARQKNIPVEAAQPQDFAPANSRLGMLQRSLISPDIQAEKEENTPPTEATDKSLLILKTRRDSDAAVYFAQILRQNRDLRPLFLLPEMNLTLEQALLLEGFPAMGILSTSLARPSLQVLKLAPAFLWEPVDVFKIMEFVTLTVKPLDDGLALEIAKVMAEKPGLFSDRWFAAVYSYLEQGEIPDEARRQYEFWFERRRYRADGAAPKRDAIGMYSFLHNWAHEHFEATGRKHSSLLVLAEQARRIRDLLGALPETVLTFLELERIVRTIYDPSPVQITPAEAGGFSCLHQAGAFAAPADTLVWWNCLFENSAPKPDKWYAEERIWLEKQDITLSTPQRESRLNLLRQQRPVLQTSSQLILIVPEQADGAEAAPSLLLGDIEAVFHDCRPFTFHLDDPQDRERLAGVLHIPARVLLESRPVGRPKPQLHLSQPHLFADSAYETPTNLESLFYYPHRWFFRQKTRMYPTSLFSVTGDQTLLGSLAHRFFEMLLKENLEGIDKAAVQEWINDKAPGLLEKEGATLLLYGREPERNAFLNRVKNAAWSLISLLRSNGWSVLHTELPLEGSFCGIPVRGKADLVLQRGEEMAIVDLKWSGARRRKELIQNGEDLQLILYANMLPPPERWPHTAYFILEDGKMIARNRAAFTDAVVAGRGDEDHAQACALIFSKMEKTFRWRMEQIRQGVVEMRTARTAPELDVMYEGELLDLLEMKIEDARWDDYRTLLEFM